MTNLLIGIVIGNFTFFAGERFLKFAITALKERKTKEAEKAKEELKTMMKKELEPMIEEIVKK